MKFSATFCDPLNPNIIDLGEIEENKVLATFESIPWAAHLAKMEAASDNEIYYSPSFEIENKENKNGLSVSAIDDAEWYIFYKRPKLVKLFFGLIERMDNNFLSEIHQQAEKDVKECLNALIRNDLAFLENKIR